MLVLKSSVLVLLIQATKNGQEVKHPDLSIQPLQSRLATLPTIPRSGAQVTASSTNHNHSSAPFLPHWDVTNAASEVLTLYYHEHHYSLPSQAFHYNKTTLKSSVI